MKRFVARLVNCRGALLSSRTWHLVLGGGIAIGVLGLSVLLRLPALGEPIDRDLGAYATIGQRLASGDMPYRDLFDHKQPLIYPVYAFLHMLSPGSTTAIRLGAAVVAAMAVGITLIALRRDMPSGHLAVAAVLALIVGASSWVAGVDLNTEHLLVLTSTAAVLVPLSLRRSSSRVLPFCAGFLAGTAVLTKAVAILIVPAGLLPLLTARHRRRQGTLATVVGFAAGAVMALALITAPFVASGSLSAFVEGNITYNRDYVSAHVPASLLESLTLPRPIALVIVVALVAEIVRFWQKHTDVVIWTLLVWLMGAVLGSKLGGRNIAHYFAPLVIPAVCLIAMPLFEAPRRWLGLAATSVISALVATPFLVDLAQQVGRTNPELSLRRYGAQAEAWIRAEEVGAFLRTVSAPGDKLFAARAEPSFYWSSQLEPATRYIYDYPRELGYDFDGEVSRAFATKPPRFVVLAGGCPGPPYLEPFLPEYQPIYFSGAVVVLERHAENTAPSTC